MSSEIINQNFDETMLTGVGSVVGVIPSAKRGRIRTDYNKRIMRTDHARKIVRTEGQVSVQGFEDGFEDGFERYRIRGRRRLRAE